MRLSDYTFWFDMDDESYFIYNSLSNSLIEIDLCNYLKLNEAKKDETKLKDLDNELYSILQDKYFITENPKDDFLLFKSSLMDIRSEDEFMHLTIAPTMDCCFNCHYCFESEKNKSYITSDIIDSIIKYVCKIKTLRNIKVTWFGGEPLMALSKMEEFYEKFRKKWKYEYSSNIITTGYHINKKTIEILKKLEISQVQITLDGSKKTHNSIKYFDEESDAFTKTINNIGLLTKLAPEINTIIRVNLTKNNAAEYPILYRQLIQKFAGRNVGISPAFVNDRGSNENNKNDKIFFNRKECTKYILDLFNIENIHTPYINYPTMFISECAIRNKNTMSFDPEGYAYKCWEMIGNKKFSVGSLDAKGNLGKINSVVLNRQLYGGDCLDNNSCKKCRYLPLCCGGCPIERIENEFEGKNNDVCTYYKNNIVEFLKAHIKLKKAGYENY